MKSQPLLPACAPTSTPVQSQTSASRSILVVDDDVFTRLLNTKVLVRSGYEVETAADGAEAWEALRTNKFDLLITDNEMPAVSGIELLVKVRAARMDLPVIMATETFPEEEFIRYPWIQPAATLLKPYTIAEFLGTVEVVLNASGRGNELITPPPKA